jgi:L-asparaginase
MDALRAAGTRGFVFTGTGAGMLSDVEKDIVRESRERGDGIVFVRSNRLGNGRVLAHGEHDELGIVPADNLNPQKARILLMLALSRAHDPAGMRRIFAQY